jgi:Papain fold toxin 2
MPKSRSPQNIWDEINQIVAAFSLLECDKCAIAVLRWLENQGIPGKVLKLKTKRRSDLYIISDRIPSNESITENGTHYGVEVLGKVFDNISGEGMSREEWLNDFHCRSGQFILEELDSL